MNGAGCDLSAFRAVPSVKVIVYYDWQTQCTLAPSSLSRAQEQCGFLLYSLTSTRSPGRPLRRGSTLYKKGKFHVHTARVH
jgi:hypothetical protein